MTERSGASLLVDCLADYGVTKVFGNPGTTELPFINAVERHSTMDYVMALHEDVAAGAAAGYSSRRRYLTANPRDSSILSVVNLHTTPGMAHGLGNLYGASYTGVPVIFTTGGQRPETEARKPPLSGDRVGMVEDYVKYATAIHEPDNIPATVKEAAEIALTPPTGPVFLDLPLGMQQEMTDEQPLQLELPKPNAQSTAGVEEAVAALNEAQNPVVIVGDQLAHAGRDAVNSLLSVVEEVGAEMYGEVLLSEISVPTYHDNWNYIMGIHQEDVEEVLATDTILYVGVRTENPLFAEDLSEIPPAGAQTIHVAADEESIGDHYDGIRLTGSISHVLSELADSIDSPTNPLSDVEARKQSHGRRNSNTRIPSATELAEVIDDELGDAVVVDEGVTSGFILRNVADFEFGQLLGQKSGGLGYGLPAAVGAAIAEEEHEGPTRNILSYVGDGSYQYYPQALYTADRYVDNALSVILVDNSGYRILRESDVLADKAPTTDRSLSFQPRIDFDKSAESYGVDAVRYDRDDSLHGVIRETLDADEVTLLTVPIQTKD